MQTPLNKRAWKRALASHLDRAIVRYLIRGISDAFRIGFNCSCPLQSSHQNLVSGREHPEVVQAYLDKERSVGCLLGPFAPNGLGILPAVHINRFGVIPKGHNAGKWRLILHLPGPSVTSGIDPELCSLSYISVDQVAMVAAKQAFVEEIRKLLRALELPEDNYAGHSFALAPQHLLSTIQLLGRSQGGAFLRYIRTRHEQLAAMSVALAS